MNRTAQPGDLVELKNKEGGFTDPDTLFDISCDQQKPLGDSIGERTHLAIQSGGLIIVGSVKKADDEAEADAKTKAEADAKAKAEADAKAKAEADAKAKAEADAKAKAEADAKAKAEADAKAKAEADAKAKAEAGK